jgi:C-terminal processing protease CtpA/Prc
VDGNGQLRVDKVGVGQNYVSCMQPTRNVMGGQAFELAAGGTMELRVVMKNQDKEDRRRGVMGFQLARHLDDFVVSAVTPGGPAEKAGLAAGDIIEKVNDKEFEDGGDALYGEPGSTVKLTIERDDKERTITLTLGTPP